MSIMGTRVLRTEDPRLLTQGGVYTDDLRLPELTGAAYVTNTSPRTYPDGLDVQAMTQTDLYTLPEHLKMLDCNADLLETMPAVLEDVRTARRYFNLVVRQTMHFACACWTVHAALLTPLPPFSHPTLSSETPSKPSLSYFDAAVPYTAEFVKLGAQKFEQALVVISVGLELAPADGSLLKELAEDSQASIHEKFLAAQKAQPAWAALGLPGRLAVIQRFRCILKKLALRCC